MLVGGLSGSGEERVGPSDPAFANSPEEATSHSVTYFPAARIYVRLVRRPRPQVLATEYPAAKVSKAR